MPGSARPGCLFCVVSAQSRREQQPSKQPLASKKMPKIIVKYNHKILTLLIFPRWARRDLNPQPRDYESPALTVELQARIFNISLYINRL